MRISNPGITQRISKVSHGLSDVALLVLREDHYGEHLRHIRCLPLGDVTNLDWHLYPPIDFRFQATLSIISARIASMS
jgi:hypothetical protein